MEINQWPDVPSWAALVKEHAEATFFHTPLWHDIIVKTYPKYSIATREFTFDDGSKAVIPLIATRAGDFFKTKTRLKSSVFGTYGGIIAKGQLSRKHQGQLYDLLRNSKASISINTNPFSGQDLTDSFACKNTFTQVFFLQPEEKLLFRCFSRGAKSNLNQAKKKGLTIRTARTEQDLATYYTVYQDTLRRWGNAVIFKYPEEIFINIFKMGGDSGKIWLAEKDGKIIAGAVVFYWNTIVSYWQGAALQDYFACYPNNMLHLEIIKEAALKGYRYYDFGPSGGQEGVIRFKKSFGAVNRPFIAGHCRYARE